MYPSSLKGRAKDSAAARLLHAARVMAYLHRKVGLHRKAGQRIQRRARLLHTARVMAYTIGGRTKIAMRRPYTIQT